MAFLATVVGAGLPCVAWATPSPVLSITGSPSLLPLLERWSEDLRQRLDDVQLRIQSTTNEEGAAALASGAAGLAAMSRPMNGVEIQTFRAHHGSNPRPVRVALDAVVLIVNAVNPLQGLTLAQVDGIFSEKPRCSGAIDITTWGQILPSGLWRTRPVRAFGLGQGVTEVDQHMRENALCGGHFKASVSMTGKSWDVVEAVEDDANAVGFVPMAFLREGVRAVPLAVAKGATPVAPVAGDILSGAYPLSRFFYLYVRDTPGIEGLARRFVSHALSEAGQRRVAEAGYVPLPAAVASEEMTKISLAPN